MGREELLLTASIKNTIHEARVAKEKLFYLMEGLSSQNVEDDHEDLNMAQETLRFYIRKIFQDTGILAERLGLPLFKKEIMQKLESILDLADLVPTPWDIPLHSQPLADAEAFFDSLAVMTEGRAISGLDVFQTILENTAKIIHYRNIEPKSEAKVRNEIYHVLNFTFRDAVREIPVGKLFKTYKPDLGVVSLMAAAEYKFVNTKQEVKKSLDEIYTDMKGYGNNYEWRTFYAVIYMTAPFYHQKDVEEEFRFIRADVNWTPIVINGAGARNLQKP